MASVRTPFRQARLSQHSACRPRIAMSVFQSPDLARIHPAMTIPVTNLRTDLCFERCSGSQLVARQANESIHSAD